MIYLITGQPGDGKSLYTITAVNVRAEKENREVYYAGIEDLRLPWVKMEDPTKWYELPVGAIIVIDEAQSIFRPRGTGSHVPLHVSQLEEHRHKGYDIYLITQHPMLVDSNVRRLVGTHLHVKRKFGAPAATVHEFNAVKEQVDKNREGSIRHEFIYPKSSYGLYKSAELHTHKVRIPMRVVMIFLIPFAIGAVVYGVWHWWDSRLQATAAAKESFDKAASSRTPTGQVGGSAKAGGAAQKTEQEKAVEFVQSFNPRLPGMAFSAPRYESMTGAQYVPVPAACLESRSRGCRCYTQQATPLNVPAAMCRDIVANGWFQDFALERPKTDDNGDLSRFGQVAPLHAEQAESRALRTPEPPTVPKDPKPDGSESRRPEGDGWHVTVRQSPPVTFSAISK